jgi:two-component system OmpR family response regulator
VASSDLNPATMKHLLAVEDDAEIANLLQRYFERQNFRVSIAGDGQAMREVLSGDRVDLVLLDLSLPGEDGLELTRYLRTHWHGPVIIVTGRGESVDRVVGLELGADDYVTKPFDLRELLARVRSVLRRSTAEMKPSDALSDTELEFNGFRLRPGARTLTDARGAAIALTAGEFDLLLALARHPNRVLTRDELMNHVHGRDAGPFDRAIDMQIGRLRRKIEIDSSNPELIKSVRAAGYIFASRVRRS